MIEEFKVNSKVDSGQLNLAHLARNKNNIRKETKTNASPHDLVQTKSKIRESSPILMNLMILFSDVALNIRLCLQHPTVACLRTGYQNLLQLYRLLFVHWPS